MTEIPGLGGGWGHGTGRRVHGRGPECHLHPAPRLAKSTLTLIPLLGTHEVIFAFVMDEHARGMLRFIKLFTELSFTSFQVTASLEQSQGGDGAGTSLYHADRQPEARGESGPYPGYVVGAEPESPSMLTPGTVFCMSTLDRKSSRMSPRAPSLAWQLLSTGLLAGGGYPARCFTYIVQLILAESQVCRIIPFSKGGN